MHCCGQSVFGIATHNATGDAPSAKFAALLFFRRLIAMHVYVLYFVDVAPTADECIDVVERPGARKCALRLQLMMLHGAPLNKESSWLRT
jgi:hypothetical protein